MKKRRYLAVLALSGLALFGCAKTPGQAVVREKSGRGVEGYQEDTQEQGESDKSEAKHTEAGDTDGAPGTESKNEGGDAQKAAVGLGAAKSAGTNTLAQKLQVPEVYEASLASEDGTFKLECGADIFVPDVQKVPVYQVTQKKFSQEFIDQVTKAFFGDAPVYDADYIYGRTKADIEEKLNELKGYMAEGNMDPYGIIADLIEQGLSEEEAKMNFNLQGQIDAWEKQYAEAPEKKEKVIVQPGIGGTLEDNEGSNVEFSGYVETEDGNYLYRLYGWSSVPMQISVSRMDEKTGSPDHGLLEYRQVMGLWDSEKAELSIPEGEENIGVTEEQEAFFGEKTGITKEEAVQKADEYMEKLGLLDEFSAKEVSLARGWWETGDLRDDVPDMHISCYGWQIDYTRDIDGFPVTSEADGGGALESMESTTQTWCYEQVQLIVNQDGLLSANIENLYDVGERRVENVQMLPFPEIAGIFEQMIQIKNADLLYTKERTIHISRVTLGYMRIYDPTVDGKTGMMVPVWDFFGDDAQTTVYEGETYYYEDHMQNSSFLTVNAADGTIIDRSLGY